MTQIHGELRKTGKAQFFYQKLQQNQQESNKRKKHKNRSKTSKPRRTNAPKIFTHTQASCNDIAKREKERDVLGNPKQIQHKCNEGFTKEWFLPVQFIYLAVA